MGQNGETEEPGCDDENMKCEAKPSIRRRQTSRKTSKTENEKVNNNEHDLHRSTGKPSHICPYCNKSLAFAGTLKRHILIHTGENSFPCSICNLQFSENFNLKRHIQTHKCDDSILMLTMHRVIYTF